jgi:hypothetical protein
MEAAGRRRKGEGENRVEMGRGKGMIKERVNSPASLDGGGDRSTLHDVSTYWLETTALSRVRSDRLRELIVPRSIYRKKTKFALNTFMA